MQKQESLPAAPATCPDIDFEPAFRGRVWFRPTPGISDMFFYASPGASDIPLHVHRTMTETFTVLEGRLDVYLNGNWHPVRAGQTFSVAPGHIHTIRNGSDAACVYSCQVSHGKRFEDMIRMYGTLISTGKLRTFKELRSLVYAGLLYDQFRDVQFMTGVKGRLLYGLARIGKLLGYQLPTSTTAVQP